MIFKASDIARYLKQPDLNIKCVVVYGPNEGMVFEYSKQFAQSVCPDLNDAFQVATLNMDLLDKDIGLLYGEYNARSLMGGRRVVMVKDASNNLTAHLKTLLKDSPSDTLLVISSSSLNSKSSLVALAKDNPAFALISCYDDREENIYTFAKEYLINNGYTISADAMQLLCARLSNDRKASTGELEKLITYLDTRRNVELKDIRAVISDTSSSTQEDMCYYAAGGEIEKALDSYRELLHEGGEPVALVRNLSNHFLKLLNGVGAIEKGQTADNFAASMRPPIMFFRKTSFAQQLRFWKRQPLTDVLNLLYQCERDCKTTNLPAEKILSYALMQIAGAARRLRR